MQKQSKIGLGGGCHWCTEAIFQSLNGVTQVAQGYIKSNGEHNIFSEAVIVNYDPQTISLRDLIEIHLHTHRSTSNHSFRKKYRSAIYYYEKEEKNQIKSILTQLQNDFCEPIITKILPFVEFTSSRQELLSYYLKNPNLPFCERYIHPKLAFLQKKYSNKLK